VTKGLIAVAAGAVLLAVAVSPGAAAARPVHPAGLRPRTTAWVQAFQSHSLLPVNPATGHVGRAIRFGRRHGFGLAITPDGRRVYDSDGGYLITPVNALTGRPGRRIRIRAGATQMLVTPDGKLLYVAGQGDQITPVRISTSRVGRPITVARKSDFLYQLVASPDSTTVYAVTSKTIVPVSTATGRLGRPIYVGPMMNEMVLSPSGRTGYVLGANNTLIPVSLTAGRARKPIRIGPVNCGTWTLAITPDGATVYVACYDTDTVVPVSTATGRAGRPIRVPGGPTELAITPDGRTVYALAWDAVFPISTATGRVGPVIRVRRFYPFDVAISSNGKTVLIVGDHYNEHKGGFATIGAGFVLPVSTATNHPGRLIRTGTGADCLVTLPWRRGRVQGPSSCST
jgi:DNA-binding beta-propeller fold protein YncE